jgi:DNA polymerase/3'-5' exonuclease PolX
MVLSQITEYLETGRIQESDMILADPRFQTLRVFASVFTIGTSTAVELYDNQGCRSLSDVTDFYAGKEGQEWDSGVVGEGVPLTKRKVRFGMDGVLGGRDGSYRWKRKTRDAVKRRQQGMMSKAEMVREWMLVQNELDQRIPRTEVHEVAQCVQKHLDAILPGCHATLTGGYRRGKLESGDIDIVICPPAPGLELGLLKSLRDRMTSAGE